MIMNQEGNDGGQFLRHYPTTSLGKLRKAMKDQSI
jgi:hypothetical protein